jgi:TRAP-type C4-dicarboxylate transport system permease small subunit
MALFGLLVVAVVAVVLVVVGGIEAAASFRQEVMPVTRISKGWTHVAVPIAGGLMLVYLAAKARVLLRVAG